ncbi:MAG: hypothetical protein KAY32_07080 [Candidatus Eisenbacteria sp.]|nr:hypothetical protein [Candidatus Eisenbacteria bacterium]
MNRLPGQALLVVLAFACFAGCSRENPGRPSDHSYRTIWVAPEGGGDFTNIQAALDSAAPGDTIILSAGTYRGPGNRDLRFQGKALTLRSASRDPQDCILDCEGTEADPHRGFILEDLATGNALLEGVTIMRGHAGDQREASGGGIHCANSTLTIRGCILQECSADRGGGLSCIGSFPTLHGCTFHGNAAREGGAVYAEVAVPLFRNCTFYGNSATEHGASAYAGPYANICLRCSIIALSAGSKAIYGEACSPWCEGYATITSCDLFGNEEGDWAGRIDDLGNYQLDPQFCDPVAGDFRLSSSSALIDSLSDCEGVGAWPIGCEAPPPSPHTDDPRLPRP